MRSEFLGNRSNDYFFSDEGRVMAKIGALEKELGCVTVAVRNAGNQWEPFYNGFRSAKVVNLQSSNIEGKMPYELSLFFSKSELSNYHPKRLWMAKTTAASIQEANESNTVFAQPVVNQWETTMYSPPLSMGFLISFLLTKR